MATQETDWEKWEPEDEPSSTPHRLSNEEKWREALGKNHPLGVVIAVGTSIELYTEYPQIADPLGAFLTTTPSKPERRDFLKKLPYTGFKEFALSMLWSKPFVTGRFEPAADCGLTGGFLYIVEI